MVRVAVYGAAGYVGIETVRLVLGHPSMDLVRATSAQDAGRALSEAYPALAGLTQLAFSEPSAEGAGEAFELAFLAVPHTAALELAPRLLEQGVTVIDLSADYRLRDPHAYERWYGLQHSSPDLLSQSVYGLPELNRESLPGVSLVACPGCYPTAAGLAAIPALEQGLVADGPILIDAKSGVSGAGRTATSATHYCAVNEALVPYKVFGHRHTPEIEQLLSEVSGRSISVAFVPHLVPMSRGLSASVYFAAADPVDVDALHDAYARRYAAEPFILVHDVGRMPSTSEVRGTNRAHIGVAVDRGSGTAVVVCAIDNLVKGAAGQALQCANIVLGQPETSGLDLPVPVV